ncbi:DUF2867 domain-containing protein [Streptomyces sp. WMMC500]|uniref:DUF2867 domain-containing protein n=1 Tax=Streptomyces sp. WMMC500 TaxID=3015154 RepID=UPI00248D10B1|nr:DUF2867 domain-containing protein [Streptomyces sp. WMMC500]WBB59539.1 DUF2867 domain-containing protein [Streptomyces sp. WMMC500]
MRTVRNVHERILDAPAAAVGALVDRLSAPDDPLFPSPAWAPMAFDRPLQTGAAGGHGPVRYEVTAYEPGRRVRFGFTPPVDGFHEITVEPLADGRCRLRHVLESRMGPVDLLMWTLVIRRAHETVVEEVFDNAELVATGAVARPVRRSALVRLLMRAESEKATAVELPAGARLARGAYERPDFSDAWQIALRPGMPRDVAAWRDVLPFPVVAREGAELLLGKDAGHLDFRASVLVEDERVTLSTVVRIHNRRGRLYFAVVRRFHPRAARHMLRVAWRRLALAAPSAGARERERAGATGRTGEG